MAFEERVYSALVVSSSEKFKTSVQPLLSSSHCEPVVFAESVSEAKRRFLEKQYDFVIINSPLPDEFGTKLAVDVTVEKTTVCLMLVKSEVYDEVRDRVVSSGVFTISKPASLSTVATALEFMTSARERIRLFQQKTVSIEEKMEEIRLVNRAKWLIIANLKMTEQEAHRYIEKQAMDTGSTKRDVAKDIVRTYS